MTIIKKLANQKNKLWDYAESVTKQKLRNTTIMNYQNVIAEKVV